MSAKSNRSVISTSSKRPHYLPSFQPFQLESYNTLFLVSHMSISLCPSVFMLPNMTQVFRGDFFLLKCDDNPRPSSVKWTLDDEELESGNGTLRITAASLNDSGSYKCEINGKKSNGFSVNVLGKCSAWTQGILNCLSFGKRVAHICIYIQHRILPNCFAHHQNRPSGDAEGKCGHPGAWKRRGSEGLVLQGHEGRDDQENQAGCGGQSS